MLNTKQWAAVLHYMSAIAAFLAMVLDDLQ
jgi:hypothetical protein